MSNFTPDAEVVVPTPPRPSFYKRTRKAWRGAAGGFITGAGAMFTLLAEAQAFTGANAVHDALNIVGGGIGGAGVAFAAVYFSKANAVDPENPQPAEG